MKTLRIATLLAPLLFVGGSLVFTPARAIEPVSQPDAEAAAQKFLPKIRDTLWTALSKCKIDYDEKSGTYSAHVTPEVQAMAGKAITVRGFILPMDGSDRTQHFLITRNTPVCLFCPPGEPNEVIEVRAVRAIPWTDKVTAVTGTFSLINNGEQALFFRIENAEVKQ